MPLFLCVILVAGPQQTSNTDAIPAMCAVHKSNNDLHSLKHAHRKSREGVEKMKVTQGEQSERERQNDKRLEKMMKRPGAELCVEAE